MRQQKYDIDFIILLIWQVMLEDGNLEAQFVDFMDFCSSTYQRGKEGILVRWVKISWLNNKLKSRKYLSE